MWLQVVGRAQRWALWPQARRFKRALSAPEPVQRAALEAMLRANADTAYGRQHGFATIKTAEEYAERVPVVTYDDLEPWLVRARAGEAGVLTAEPIRAFVGVRPRGVMLTEVT